MIKTNKSLRVRYGNRYVTSLKPQYFDYDYSLDTLNIEVDGKHKKIRVGDKINVERDFRVLAEDDYRVNIIGYSKHGRINENGILVRRKQIQSRFSIDKNEKIFRVELYKGNKFSGMILVNFVEQNNSMPLSMKDSGFNRISSSKL